MLSFLQAMKWVYISVLYTEGPYGENAAKQITLQAKQYGICVEVLQIIPFFFGYQQEAVDEAVEKLFRYPQARVVVGFFEQYGSNIERTIVNYGADKQFIFIGSDTVYFGLDGIFRVQPVRGGDDIVQKVENYFYQRDPKVLPEDPWLRRLFAEKNQCSWNPREDEVDCYDVEDDEPLIEFSMPFNPTNRKHFRQYDVVFLYAKGIEKAIQNDCSTIPIEDKAALRKCVRGWTLIKNLKNVEHEGTIKIKIDENGDAYARWVMYQNQIVNGRRENILVGSYDELEEPKLKLFFDKIDWTPFEGLSTQVLSVDDKNFTTPQSVCSKPCTTREYYVQQELPCCWDCRTCHVNEIIINKTLCEPCPFGQWPDEDTATECIVIEKTYLKLNYWVTLFLIAVSIFGLLFTLYTSVFYVLNREKKIIKATSRELCSIILCGLSVAYIAAMFYLIKPVYWSCLVNRHGFNLAVALIYAPLLIKTNRIYRIFKATQKGIKSAKFIDSNTQILLSLLLILLQVS